VCALVAEADNPRSIDVQVVDVRQALSVAGGLR
jgi:hypothetical protein